MNKSRLEAFSDGFFAIIITIMVLEIKAPEGKSWEKVEPIIIELLSYVLSFVFIAIYWINHHHLIHTLKKAKASAMWANMNLLFWLSLIPFITHWMGVNEFDKITVAVYGALLLMCALSFSLLSRAIKSTYEEETAMTKALARSNKKEFVSVVLYAASIPVALFIHPVVSAAMFVIVSVMWVIPSKAIEEMLAHGEL